MTDWQGIVNKFGPAVWRTAYKLLDNHTDAAEVFSETFVSALKLSKRQRMRHFSALLTRIATAKAIDRLRRRYRNREFCTAELDLSATSAAKQDLGFVCVGNYLFCLDLIFMSL